MSLRTRGTLETGNKIVLITVLLRVTDVESVFYFIRCNVNGGGVKALKGSKWKYSKSIFGVSDINYRIDLCGGCQRYAIILSGLRDVF